MNKDQKMLDICFLVLIDYARELGKHPDNGSEQMAIDLKAKKKWLDTAPKGSYDTIFEAMKMLERELEVK